MNDMSLKAKIRNMAEEYHISAQAVLQSYLMCRLNIASIIQTAPYTSRQNNNTGNGMPS